MKNFIIYLKLIKFNLNTPSLLSLVQNVKLEKFINYIKLELELPKSQKFLQLLLFD